MSCGRELARKYGSVSLSPYLPSAAQQPVPSANQSTALPTLIAAAAADVAPSAPLQVSGGLNSLR